MSQGLPLYISFLPLYSLKARQCKRQFAACRAPLMPLLLTFCLERMLKEAMTFHPVPNAALCRIVMSFRGQLSINDLWFASNVGAPTQTGVFQLGQDVYTKWAAGPLSLLSSDISLSYVITTDMTAFESWQGVFAGPPAVGAAGDAMPNNVAFVASLRTGMSGRAKRGRIYLPAIPRSVVAENDVIASFIADMSISLNGFVGDGAVSVGWELAVAHRRTTVLDEVVWLPEGQTFPVQFIAFTDTVVDSQRRRLPGRGR